MENRGAADVCEVDGVLLILDDERHEEWDAWRLAEPTFDLLIGANIHFVFLAADFDGDGIGVFHGFGFWFCDAKSRVMGFTTRTFQIAPIVVLAWS